MNSLRGSVSIGQRRGGRAERNGSRIGAAVIAIAEAAAAVVVGRDFERRQRRILANVLRGDLVGRGAGVRFLADGRVNAGEPGAGRKRMHRAHGRLIVEVAEHRGHRLVLVERLQDLAELADFAFARGRPLVHHRAMGEVDESQVRRGLRRRLRQRGARRNHGVEQRQREGGAGSPQYRAARQMLLGDEHFGLLYTYFAATCCRAGLGFSTS